MAGGLRAELLDLVGEAGLVEDTADQQPFLTEWRGNYQGEALFVVRPATVEELCGAVAACARRGVAMVPQGGNTGLCGGAVSHAGEVLLSLSRLNRVRGVDAANYSLTVDAGCTLANAQQAAASADRMLALSLSAEGSCHVGGNLSTNAGGVNVVKYGCAREQVLGLEVVLADGRLWSQLQGLRKNTAGYDLKQLFVGAEGTLGVISGATLKLFPMPEVREVLWVTLADHAALLRLFAAMRQRFGNTIAAFELIPDIAVEFVSRHIGEATRPASGVLHALIELHGGSAEVDEAAIHAFVAAQLEAGEIDDAIVAQGERQRAALWSIRHHISEAQRHEGASIKHDIALPIGAIADFVTHVSELVEEAVPGVRVVCFGHVGDGNLHFNLSQPTAMQASAFMAERGRLNGIVHAATLGHGGTVSAEHGIGLLKRDILGDQVGSLSIDLMKTVKRALDPNNLMNPGKVL